MLLVNQFFFVFFNFNFKFILSEIINFRVWPNFLFRLNWLLEEKWSNIFSLYCNILTETAMNINLILLLMLPCFQFLQQKLLYSWE